MKPKINIFKRPTSQNQFQKYLPAHQNEKQTNLTKAQMTQQSKQSKAIGLLMEATALHPTGHAICWTKNVAKFNQSDKMLKQLTRKRVTLMKKRLTCRTFLDK